MESALKEAIGHLFEQGRQTEALARIAQIPDERIQSAVMHQTLSDWARTDPREAVDWLIAGQSAILSPHALVRGLIAIADGGDPGSANELLHQITDPTMRSNVVSSLAQSSGPALETAPARRLLDWIETFPPAEREQARQSVVRSKTYPDPPGAAALLATFPPEAELHSSWSQIAHNWVDQDAAAAAAFFRERLDLLPDTAIYSLATAWLDSAPQDASAWVAELPVGRPRDAAIGSMVSHLANKSDLEPAVLWADEIADQSIRQQALDTIANAAEGNR
ncbi:hypothetical protein BH23VER1_BH23VER1_24070 [soil metagenome]